MDKGIVEKIIEENRVSMEYPPNSIANELINPCLKEFTFARREAAWFRASALRSWAASLEPIIKKDIKIEFLISPQVDKTTFRALKEATEFEKLKIFENYSNEILNKAILLKLNPFNHSKETGKTVGQILSYLVLSKKLEFKFIDVLDIDRIKVYEDEIDDEDIKTELNHIKKGYFRFPSGQELAYEGSFNESASALNKQGESCQLMVSGRDEIRLEDLKKRIDDKWNEEREGVRVRGLSKEILEKLEIIHINSGGDTISTEGGGDFPPPGGAEDERVLREHQKEAIKAWAKNGKQGIFDHATGSGKTFTALKTIQAVRKDINQLGVVIGVPYIPLADQWLDEVNEFFGSVSLKEKFIFNGCIGCYSGERNWQTKIRKEFLQFKNSVGTKKDHLSVILVVNKTLMTEEFQEILANLDINSERFFFIGDECHRYTTKKTLASLPKMPRYKLGLSATAFNDPGNLNKHESVMKKYFNDICHTYTLQDALNDDHLCEYEYKPLACYLDEEEFFEWKEYLGKYDEVLLKTKKENYEHKEKMENVIENSKQKYEKFEALIKNMSLEEKKHTIVFCGERKIDDMRTIDYVNDLLNENDWSFQTITAEESRQERKSIINGFKRGDIQSISAMRVLDEGVDIPIIKQAIILASSTKRRQFVQRRGRVLRKNDDKEKAIIYDFIVLPPPNFSEGGKELLHQEVSRVQQMGEDALNKKEVEEFINEYTSLYEIA